MVKPEPIPGIKPGMTRAEKQKVYRRRYTVTAKGRAVNAKAQQKFLKTSKGKAKSKRANDKTRATKPERVRLCESFANAMIRYRQGNRTNAKDRKKAAHFESTFEDWMSWKNYGKYTISGDRTWCVGHIIPASAYDGASKEDMKRCYALPNLIAQCSKENAKCRDQMPPTEELIRLKEIWPLAWAGQLPA